MKHQLIDQMIGVPSIMIGSISTMCNARYVHVTRYTLPVTGYTIEMMVRMIKISSNNK